MRTVIKLETQEEVEKFNEGLQDFVIEKPCLINDMFDSICIHPLEEEEEMRYLGYFICKLEAVPSHKIPFDERATSQRLVRTLR